MEFLEKDKGGFMLICSLVIETYDFAPFVLVVAGESLVVLVTYFIGLFTISEEGILVIIWNKLQTQDSNETSKFWK